MKELLGVGGAIAFGLVVAVYLLRRTKTKDDEYGVDDIDIGHQLSSYSTSEMASNAASKPRLTELQFAALLSASLEAIYIEGDGRHAAGTYEPMSYPKRTIESLVKRGLLEPAAGGGFRATSQGQAATVG